MSDVMPLIGRCKECDYAVFADESATIPAEELREVRADGRVYRMANGGYLARCNNRHRVFPLKRIKGTFSKDHQCDARCLNAKGSECTCSCGGVNHGRGHAVTVVEASAKPTDLTPSCTEKQARYIRLLIEERHASEESKQKVLKALDEGEVSRAKASEIIEWLLDRPLLKEAA